MTEHKWRRSDFISLTGIIIICGWIWAASAKNSKLEAIATAIEDKEMGLSAHERRIIKVEEAIIYFKKWAEDHEKRR